MIFKNIFYRILFILCYKLQMVFYIKNTELGMLILSKVLNKIRISFTLNGKLQEKFTNNFPVSLKDTICDTTFKG